MVRSVLLASAAVAVAEAGTLTVTYADCGAKHAHVDSLSPTSIHTGATETLTGTGTSDEVVTSAHFTATVSALGAKLTDCSGDGTKDIVCSLPMGVGKITVKALSFPLAAGTVNIPVEVQTSSLIPASLANVDVHIEATEQNGESVICLDVHTTQALASTHLSFEEWAAQYGFNGADDTMKSKYNANLAEIDSLNAADNGATFAVNQFSGMTFEEFEAVYLTNTEPEYHNVDPSKVPVTYLEEDPLAASVESIDWVSKGGVTPVKDQGSCGSCWAFSTMASVESVHRINSGQIANLAEQQLVDCNTGNSGCSGGSATSALQWLVSNTACTTTSYPYKATQGSCQSCSSSNVAVGGVNLVTSRSESALQSALGGSPASVSVYADSAWQHYSSGVLQAAATCSHNHAVLAVGYTSDAWKIKNSWGSSFGESGYIRIAKGLGGCGASGIVTSSPRIPTGVAVESVVV